jgi:hypothetical protein
MTKQQNYLRENIWVKGRQFYSRHIVIKIAVLLIVSLSFLTFWNYYSGESVTESLKIFGLIFLVFIGLTYFAAIRFWNYYEQEYFLQKENRIDKSTNALN